MQSHSSLVNIDWNPSPRKLRQFAFCLALFSIVVAWYQGASWPLAVVVSFVLAISFLWPAVLKPVFLAISLVTLPLGFLFGELALLLIYFGVFLPIGCLFRIIKRDALQRQLRRDALSYWEVRPAEPAKKSYLRRY